MGMLSKKRKVPRIVKKRKRHDKKMKKRVVPKDISDPQQWSGDKTPQQNYEVMGLVLNNKPSMRQSKQGKALMTEARLRMNKSHYAEQGIIDEDIEEMQAVKDTKNEADLASLFPEIKSKKDAIIKPTVRRLKADEKQICERLIKKYGLESYGKMARDIKVNYLQWSKGQIAKNIELYRSSIGEIKLDYKDE
uniref:Nucleolar protein 16 n=1 Tax=Favella ehrenbergii TaxID=182087 RepID=A0A7S3MM35_9SPIT